MTIVALHGLIYSDDAPATRAFFRDVLGWPFVEDSSSGDGWLIFDTGPSELGVHPTSSEWEGKVYESPRHHSIAVVCDDIAETRAELAERGATFCTDVNDEGFGLTTLVELPGADPIMLYEPRHTTIFDR